MEKKVRGTAAAWVLMLLVVRTNSQGNLPDCKLVRNCIVYLQRPPFMYIASYPPSIRSIYIMHGSCFKGLRMQCFCTKKSLHDSELFYIVPICELQCKRTSALVLHGYTMYLFVKLFPSCENQDVALLTAMHALAAGTLI